MTIKPPKLVDKNYVDWLSIFERVSDINNWSEEEKLTRAVMCLTGSSQSWALHENHGTWNSFVSDFKLRYFRKETIYTCSHKLMTLKQKSNESNRKYLARVEKLWHSYLLVTHAAITTRTTGGSKVNEEDSATTLKTPSAITHSPDHQAFESILVKSLIKGLKSHSLRRTLRIQCYTTVPDFLKGFKHMNDLGDSSDDDTDSEEETINSDSSSTDSDSSADSKGKKKSKATKDPLATEVSPSTLVDLTESMKQISIALLATQEELKDCKKAIVSTNSTYASAVPEKTKNAKDKLIYCGNCKGTDHKGNTCTSPCKYCQGNHLYYQCQQHQANSKKAEEKSSDAKLCQLRTPEFMQDALAVTRSSQSLDKELEPKAKKVKITEDKDADPMDSTPTPPTEDVDTPKVPLETPVTIDKSPVVAKETRERTKHVSISSLSTNSIKAMDLLNSKVFQVSLAQLAEMNSSFRTTLKEGLTRKNQPRKTRQSALHITEDTSRPLPSGLSAPHTMGKVAGFDCPMILDGGCTSCIISKNLVLYLGFTELDATNTRLMVANGESIHPLGLLRNLSISVGPSKTVEVEAICLNVDDYDFLVGRQAFYALGLETNWENHLWHVVNDSSIKQELMVNYSHARMTGEFALPTDQDHDMDQDHVMDQDVDQYSGEAMSDEDSGSYYDTGDEHSAYLVAFAGMAESQNPQGGITDSKLGDLIMRIQQNSIIKDLGLTDQVIDCINKNIDCFGTNYQHLKQTPLTELHIETGDHPPIYRRPYGNLSHDEKEFLRSEINEMVNNGIIIPNTYVPGNSKTSGWSFPCRLIAKKTGDKRLVTNFTELNKITVRDTWPLPLMMDLLEQLGGSKFFSSMDLLKGFHQIAVNEQSINKLTIATPFGNYSYVVMPFGINNGPSTFCRAIHLALNNSMNSSVVAYIDDIIVHSGSADQHLADLETFFMRIKQANMVLNANKCTLFETSVKFVGFIADTMGYYPDPQRTKAIALFPRPVCQKDVRAFLGIIGFYRRHIHLFTDYIVTLTELLKKNVEFVWSKQMESCFQRARLLLQEKCLLYYPDHTKTFHLFTDASDLGIGAALCHMDDQDQDYLPVAFLSRKLQPAEIKYPTVEKELLAVVYAFKNLRKFLLDKPFVLYTDNTAVTYLFVKQEASQRLQRWVLCCLEYNFTVKHLPGKLNVVADVLSRYPPSLDELSNGLDDIEHLYHGLLCMQTHYEPELCEIYKFLQHPWNSAYPIRTRLQARHYRITSGKLHKKIGDRVVVVPFLSERPGIIQFIHDGFGHFGQHATWTHLYLHYWWPSAYNDIKIYITSCDECQLYNYPRSKHNDPFSVVGEHLFQQFSIDFVGPFPTSNKGNKFIILAVENFTRWPIAIATKDNDAYTTAVFLYEHIFCQFGPPSHLLSDNGMHFLNNLVEQFLELVKTRHKTTSIYHPQTNGMAERINGVIVGTLKKMAMKYQERWDELLPAALYSYRIKVHTELKISPFEALYGQIMPIPLDDVVFKVGRTLGFERLVKLWGLRDTMENQYQALINKNDELIHASTLHVGDLVVILDHRRTNKNKLHQVYQSKVYKIVKAYRNAYELVDDKNVKYKNRVNARSLKKYHPRVQEQVDLISSG